MNILYLIAIKVKENRSIGFYEIFDLPRRFALLLYELLEKEALINENKGDSTTKDRWAALDELRGFAVLLLIIFNGFYLFSSAPEWLRHAPIGKYHIADMVAPLFLFAVGLAYPLSFKKRAGRDGKFSAILHVFKRGLILILFGSVGDWLINRNFSFHWGTLEMIGLCGILALPSLLLKPLERIGLAICSVIIWQVLLGWPGIPELVNIHNSMGGPVATISWVSAVMIASAFSEWKKEFSKSEYLSGIITLGIILHLLAAGAKNLFVTDKLIVNAPYMLFSLELAVATFVFFYLKELCGFKPLPLLNSLGKNALALYMLSGVINQLCLSAFGADMSFPQLIVVAILQILLNIGIGLQLARRKIYFAL